MAISYFAQTAGVYVAYGLVADTKPTTMPDGCLFVEIDTALMYVSVSNAWVIKTTGANLSLTDITTNDVNTTRHGFFPKLPAATGKYLKDDLTWATITGGGDVVGPVVSVASQIALFDGVTGKLIKADATTGLVKATAGVISAAVADTDYASVATVALKAPLANPTFTGTVTLPAQTVTLAMQANMATSSLVYRKTAGAGVPEINTLATLKTDLALVKADVGLGSVDNTADTAKPVSTAQQTALNLKADLASPTFTGTPTLPTGTIATTQAAADSTTKVATTAFVTTANNLKANLASPTLTGTPTLPTGTIATTQAAGNNTTAVATTAFVTAINNNASYRSLFQASGSHIAGRVAGTYALSYGDVAAITGVGTLYPLGVVQIVSADYPTINGITTKLRIGAQLYTNDVAPTGNFTFGLYPITRPATSGGAGLNIFTLGTVVTGSNGATFTAPAADLLGSAFGADFALPADGPYVIGVVTTATVAVSSHVHLHAQLQMRNA